MKDYSDFPPARYLERVLKTAPKSAWLYIQIWKKKNQHSRTTVEKRDVRKEFVVTPTKFRNLLEPLMFLNIVTFEDVGEKFYIEFMGPHLNE